MIPQFEWGEETLTMTLPMMPWTYGTLSIGGADVSAAGLPASFVVREQETLTLTLRVREEEWPDVLEFIRVGMAGTEIDWLPDVDAAEAVGVFFESPRTGENIEVQRDSFERVLLVSFTIRKADATDFGLVFYEDDE
jgi:hypothetical protein